MDFIPFSNSRSTAIVAGAIVIGCVVLFEGSGAAEQAAIAPDEAVTKAAAEPARQETALVLNADGTPYDPSAGFESDGTSDPYGEQVDDYIDDEQSDDFVDQYESAPEDDPEAVSAPAPVPQAGGAMGGARID